MRIKKDSYMSIVGLKQQIAELEKEVNRLKKEKKKVQQNQNKLQAKTSRASIYLDNILANLPENFYWVDENSVVLGCNDNQARLFGLNSAAELIGKSIYDVAKILGWNNSIPDTVRKNDIEVMATRRSIKAEETALLEGKTRTFLSFKNPLVDEKNQVIGVFGVTLDITERKELENSLKEAKEKAETINQLKTEFIRNMEHDIRTPFSGIYAISKILAEKEKNTQKKEYLQDIMGASKELLDYANQILSFSQVESESVPILSKKILVKDILESVIAMELPAAKYKKLLLKINFSKQIPPVVIGDPHRLKSILINLISNAIKFTNKGSVSITVEMAKKSERLVVLKFFIQDTGIGIPKEKQLFIYEKFVRATPANEGVYKGFGLGLRIVKQFVHEMEGEIEVESKEGKGTCFTFALPFNLPLSNVVIEEADDKF